MLTQGTITAIMMFLCRQRFIGPMENMFTGEQHAYGRVGLKHLLKLKVGCEYLWYDINCK